MWILYGDGSVGFTLSEFDTFVRHGLPVIAVVGNDAGWAQIARDQVTLLGDDVGTVLARTAYHEVAAGFGAKGILVQKASELPAALREAKQLAKAGTPVLVNVHLDRARSVRARSRCSAAWCKSHRLCVGASRRADVGVGRIGGDVVGSLLLVPKLIARAPADFFTREAPPRRGFGRMLLTVLVT